MRLLYLTPGCFDKGGISRYNRYQITALRELLGEGNVYAYSFLGPDDAGFETPFSVTFHGNGANIPSKSFMLRALWRTRFVTDPKLSWERM